MVGDSAVTRLTGKGKIVTDDACKLPYAKAANIGFALWGKSSREPLESRSPVSEDSLWLIVI
jgi:hypothetical protein